MSHIVYIWKIIFQQINDDDDNSIGFVSKEVHDA